ncbi:MAG: holo-ACP synthase [Thermoanaerobaculia bacterium]|nr:holo-ACP synthase [Thermoanaerobaculia bacterium]
MTIVGLGVDLVDLGRIEGLLDRYGDRFPARICRPGEIGERAGRSRVQRVGGLFAAKEAALKALGTGWAKGLRFRDVEIRHRESGAPVVHLHGSADRRARALGVNGVHCSISHERSHAVAVVVLVGNG